MITEAEISPGLVLHLDPETLDDRGGTYTCTAEERVRGGHFFICLSIGDGTGTWLPLFSNPGVGRVELTTGGRAGHPKWTDGSFYWHQNQVWTATHVAVVAAAAAGHDMSRLGSRNQLEETNLPSLAGNGG